MKVGFIGVGNMGGAILKGCLEKGAAERGDVFAFDADTAKLAKLEQEEGIGICGSIADLVKRSDLIFLGVKPGHFETVLPETAQEYTGDKVLISMAAGISIAFIEARVGADAKVIRIMPNTPALVGEGMTAVCRNRNIKEADMGKAFSLLTAIGKAAEVPEDLIHCVIGVSGSSPAYTYMYIEALAEAAVKNGMTKEQAIVFAAQSVLGAARMVLETGVDPKQLRINVCSPGGTTIEAVEKLEELDFAGVVGQGFQAAAAKSKIMTK